MIQMLVAELVPNCISALGVHVCIPDGNRKLINHHSQRNAPIIRHTIYLSTDNLELGCSSCSLRSLQVRRILSRAFESSHIIISGTIKVLMSKSLSWDEHHDVGNDLYGEGVAMEATL